MREMNEKVELACNVYINIILSESYPAKESFRERSISNAPCHIFSLGHAFATEGSNRS